MNFVGIDIGSETHFAAAVSEQGTVTLKPQRIEESAEGHAALLASLKHLAPIACVALEATGHYWKNLAAALLANGYPLVVLNPLQASRFQQENLVRTKTDGIDALGLARLAQQKRPQPTRLPDAATDELRELVRHRDRLVQDFGDRVRQLHRLVDLTFPEFTRIVRTLGSRLATTILLAFPSGQAIATANPGQLAALSYDGRHAVGPERAKALIQAARNTVGAHQGEACRAQVRHICQDLDLWRQRLAEIDREIDGLLQAHEVGRLLTTIEGIGPQTAARLIAELDDPARFKSAGALASYIGLVPALRQSGKRTGQRAGLSPIGKAGLRRALWMPTLGAVRRSPWLKAFYDGLCARGKPAKLALIAAMRKLTTAIWTVARQRRPWKPMPSQEATA